MMRTDHFDESTVEQAAKEWLAEIGFHTGYAPVDAAVEDVRDSLGDCILWSHVANALTRLNPGVDPDLVRSAVARIQRAESQDVMSENQRLHELMVRGVPVETTGDDGRPSTVRLQLVDFDTPGNNDWRALNQFTIIEAGHNRRPDVLIFLNGLPVGLLELKNPADENATLRNAWNQIQTYRREIPSVFIPNVVTVISDGTSAAMSSFTGGFEHYAPWKTIDGRDVITNRPALEVLLKGVFAPERFLDILRNFVVYVRRGGHRPCNRAAAPRHHQTHREVPPVLGRQRRSGINRTRRRSRWGQAWWRGVAHPGLRQEL